jgi:hypothetical protein
LARLKEYSYGGQAGKEPWKRHKREMPWVKHVYFYCILAAYLQRRPIFVSVRSSGVLSYGKFFDDANVGNLSYAHDLTNIPFSAFHLETTMVDSIASHSRKLRMKMYQTFNMSILRDS